MSKWRIIAALSLLILAVIVSAYFGPSSGAEGRPVNIDLTGPFLIVVCIVVYRRYKAMQLQIEELITSVAELKSVVGQLRGPGAGPSA